VPLSRDELVALAGRIIRLEANGRQLDEWVATFKDNVADPSALDLVFWSNDPLTPEQLVDRALTPPAAERLGLGVSIKVTAGNTEVVIMPVGDLLETTRLVYIPRGRETRILVGAETVLVHGPLKEMGDVTAVVRADGTLSVTISDGDDFSVASCVVRVPLGPVTQEPPDFVSPRALLERVDR
jgi:hypothetical protein